MRATKKFFRVYFAPLMGLVFVLELCSFIVLWYLKHSEDGFGSLRLGVETLLTLVVTFSGVYFALWLERRLKKEDDRRTLAFTMGVLWTELRKDSFILEQIKANFSFSVLFGLHPFRKFIDMLLAKYKFVDAAAKTLSCDIYESSVSSGGLSTFLDDDVFNMVTQAYENIANFRLFSLVTASSMLMKQDLMRQSGEELSELEEKLFRNELGDTLRKGLSELNFCQASIGKASLGLESELNKLGVKTTLEPRDLDKELELP